MSVVLGSAKATLLTIVDYLRQLNKTVERRLVTQSNDFNERLFLKRECTLVRRRFRVRFQG